MRTTMRAPKVLGMRTTLELPDPLFAWLKARAARRHIHHQQAVHYSEQQAAEKAPMPIRRP
jgi:predicted DNA-binding ribbon-helix-helix protein